MYHSGSYCEAAIHAMKDIFDEEDTANAFNSINRKAFIHNIKVICPEISAFVSNCYYRNGHNASYYSVTTDGVTNNWRSTG